MSHRSRLLFAGMLLFLVGIFTGAANQLFHNPHLGLSAHLIAVLNGMFLMIVGLAWERLVLSPSQKSLAFGLVVFGAYMNWVLTMLGAIFGTKKLTPIAGAGYDATDVQEMLVGGGLVIMILAMIVGVGLLLWGLRKELPSSS